MLTNPLDQKLKDLYSEYESNCYVKTKRGEIKRDKNFSKIRVKSFPQSEHAQNIIDSHAVTQDRKHFINSIIYKGIN